MVRFGINGIHNKELSFFGKIAFFIHGNPHIAKFLQSHYTVKKIINLIKSKKSEEISNVLDVCCGSGDYSFFLAEKYTKLKIYAIDLNLKNIENAQKIQKKNIQQHKIY